MANAGKSCASCGGQYGSEVLFCPLDGTPLSSSRTLTASPNEIDPYLFLELPGQIQLNALVGIGSMGRVYRAFQSGVERDVAVKILHRELTGNQELVGRFHREAKIASRLVHPNVVQVLMTGTLPPSIDMRTGGEVYLVMEYLDGISLLSALAAQGEGGALPLARTLHIILQLCEAVGEAHVNNIIHRDLKPENIMLVRRGEDPDFVKVLDFGIARLDSAIEGSTTQAGLIFGTAKYISPEGAEGKHVGPQADCYAIATILYQCLAGRTPFTGDSPMALLVQQIHGTPTDLRSVPRAAYVPESIARVVMGNLSKDAEERSENARAFGRELSLAARDAGLHLDTMHGGSPRGDLRLLSKQRTRQHEFSADLKAKIASMPSSSSRGGESNGASNGAGHTPPESSALGRTEGRNGEGSPGRARPITTYEEAPAVAVPRPVPPSPPAPSRPGLVGPGLTGPPRPGHTEIGARPSRQSHPAIARGASEHAPGPTQVPGDDTHAPGHTQVADDTINGSLQTSSQSAAMMTVQRLREEGILERPGPTIPGSPLGSSDLPRAVPPAPPALTPPEAHVEGPISSQRSSPLTNAAAAIRDSVRGSTGREPAPSAAHNGKGLAGSRPAGSAPSGSKGPPPLPSEDGTLRPDLPPSHNGGPPDHDGRAAAGAPARRKPKPDPTLTAEPVVRKPKLTSLGEPINPDLPPPRQVTWRTFALIASLAVIVPIGALGAAKLFGKRAPETQSYESTLTAAQEAMDKRAWDSPPGANVKELTDKLLAQSPGDHDVLSLRSRAAESIVNDGIRARSNGDSALALRLFRLANELDPGLDTAKSMIRELEQTNAAATATAVEPVVVLPPQVPATAPSAKASQAASTKVNGKGPRSTAAPKGTDDPLELPIPDLNPPPPKETSTPKDGPFI